MNRFSITPGTIFLQKVEQILQTVRMKTPLIVNSASVSGEGECKIFQAVKQLKNGSICIVGQDADLALIGIGSNLFSESDIRICTMDHKSIQQIQLNELFSYFSSFSPLGMIFLLIFDIFQKCAWISYY